MSSWVLSASESVLFIALFLLAIYLLIPKAVKFWHLWKGSGKVIHLSNAIACGIVAVSFLLANIFMFLRAVLGV